MNTEKKNFKKYTHISRYESFPYFYDSKNERYYYGITSNLVTENVGYVVYKVKAGDSFDSIALDNYGSPLFYWVICDFNKIGDAFSTPTIGTQLKLPSLNSIKFKE